MTIAILIIVSLIFVNVTGAGWLRNQNAQELKALRADMDRLTALILRT